MKNFLRKYWDAMILIVFIVAIATHSIHTWTTCDGTVVRGLFTLECIK